MKRRKGDIEERGTERGRLKKKREYRQRKKSEMDGTKRTGAREGKGTGKGTRNE